MQHLKRRNIKVFKHSGLAHIAHTCDRLKRQRYIIIGNSIQDIGSLPDTPGTVGRVVWQGPLVEGAVRDEVWGKSEVHKDRRVS